MPDGLPSKKKKKIRDAHTSVCSGMEGYGMRGEGITKYAYYGVLSTGRTEGRKRLLPTTTCPSTLEL